MKKLNGEEKRNIAAVALRHIKSSDKTQMLSDGHGLYLVVMTTGSKYWRYRFRFAGKQKQLALGVFPDISLSEARRLHREAYNQVADGIDPAEGRREEKQAQLKATGNSFEAVAGEWLDVHMSNKTADHKRRADCSGSV